MISAISSFSCPLLEPPPFLPVFCLLAGPPDIVDECNQTHSNSRCPKYKLLFVAVASNRLRFWTKDFRKIRKILEHCYLMIGIQKQRVIARVLSFDMQTENAEEHDTHTHTPHNRLSVRCVIDRGLYNSIYDDLSSMRSAVYNHFQASVIKLAYARLWWKDISRMMLLGAQRGAFFGGNIAINFNGNVIQCIMNSWLEMLRKENKELELRLKYIDEERNELYRMFVVIDTPFRQGSSRDAIEEWVRTLAVILG